MNTFLISNIKLRIWFFFTLIAAAILPGSISAQNDDCLVCHEDKDLSLVRNGRIVPLFLNAKQFNQSIHKDLACTDCHQDFDAEELPHKEGSNISRVDCSTCHDEAVEKFERSLHGQAQKKKLALAPKCESCHTKHFILPSTDPRSQTYVMNIPASCGQCHKEGTKVSSLQTISQQHILENYSFSIHGEALLKKGLIVTAVCTSCHTAHDILPHENPESSINRKNIAKTCMQCHSQIESVHQKVINGELWEKKSHVIPACIDCHQPHKVRKVFYADSLPDESCMKCHTDKNIHKVIDGQKISLYVDAEKVKNSVHKENSCVKCHTNVDPRNKPVCVNSGKVDCSICHAEEVNDYNISSHGRAFANMDTKAPYCTSCHGDHDIIKNNDPKAKTYLTKIPNLCGECHKTGVFKTKNGETTEEIVKSYKESIHGKGMMESGLTVSATCTSCHSTHKELPPSDPSATINKHNISKTCGECHLGIYEQFNNSIHSPRLSKSDEPLPVCVDCHFPHAVSSVDMDNFRQSILAQCGNCHESLTESYFETFHGKVSNLGLAKSAKCHDCHGAHNILPVSNPTSTLNRINIIGTCKKCHPNSNRKFVGYLSHATHHDKDKYPILYYTYWFMSSLLIGTFTFFGIHTLLWLPRSLAERRKKKNLEMNIGTEKPEAEKSIEETKSGEIENNTDEPEEKMDSDE
ncbi:MAG: hypothetical protein V1720_07900 [bacterium]